MKKIFALLLLVLVPTFAQDKLGFEYDYAQFAYNADSNYVEVYYSFDQSSLRKTDSKVNALMKIVVVDTLSKTAAYTKEFRLNIPIVDSVAPHSFVGVVSILLGRGNYVIMVEGKDLNDEGSNRLITDRIKVIPLITSSFSLSNIQLASQILQESKNTKSLFYKNTYEVTPIPLSVFGINQPTLFYYYEVYGLNSVLKTNTLKITTYVFNSKKVKVFEKTKTISHPMDTQVQVGTIPVSKLPNDTYTLIVALVDSSSNKGVSSSKKFFVYNPGVQEEQKINTEVGSAISSEFGSLSEEELDDIYAKSKYVMTNQEASGYAKLQNTEGKREYLYKFWKHKDSDANTAEIEEFKGFLNKVEIANMRYATMQKPGWKTDRGRVYIQYGEPSEIERYPNQVDTKPFEVWKYNDLQGGTEFDFGDVSGFSEYILLNSTVRGEMRDDNWMRRLQTM